MKLRKGIDLKKVKEMYDFIIYFNDGSFMNQSYRKGIMDALAFILYSGQSLERIKGFMRKEKEGEQKKSADFISGQVNPSDSRKEQK